jgi:hypothetical protein
MRRRVVLVIALTFALAACGSDGPHASIDPGTPDLGADAAGDDGTSPPWDAASADHALGPDGGTPDSTCQPNCLGKECGNDGCGGSCGSCGAGQNCQQNECAMGCDSAACALGKACTFADGTAALCGGTLTFDTGMQGQALNVNVSVEEMFSAAGTVFYTDNADSVVATNHWELDSTSGKNSCASFDKYGQPWRDAIIVRFVKPTPGGLFQAGTHFVSLYVGDSWPGGIAVDFYAPEKTPGNPGAAPFHTELTGKNGTDFIKFASGEPVGFVVIHEADDPDFTMDDLTFGPLYVP